jgi:hypothetical protein
MKNELSIQILQVEKKLLQNVGWYGYIADIDLSIQRQLTIKILKDAKELLQNVGWIKGQYFRKKSGLWWRCIDDIDLKETEGFCLTGAIYYCAYKINKYWVKEGDGIYMPAYIADNPLAQALLMLCKVIMHEDMTELRNYNDDRKTTKADVLKVIDEAIKIAG